MQMKRSNLFLQALLSMTTIVISAQDVRSARPLPQAASERATQFDRRESAALFVGVRKFSHDRTLTEVRYGVDDAIDLAYAVAIDRRVKLVVPDRVVIALSGEPQKSESKDRLRRLIEEGANVIPAAHSDVLTALEQQGRMAGSKGVLIVSFATHGFTRDGIPHLLTASSILAHPKTSISASEVADIAARSDAARALIFLDACRERLTTGTRAGDADPVTPAPLIDAMTRAEGLAVFYAAAAGKYAYDDDEKGNGVFTTAILDALRCQAATDAQGLVTVETLAAYVEARVLSWIQKHRNPAVRTAIQVSADGGTKSMPLAQCGQPHKESQRNATSPAPPADPRPARVVTDDAFLTAFGDDGTRLWGRSVNGRIARAEVVDLNGDGQNEVVAGVGGSGEDAGSVVAFDTKGNRLWAATTKAPFNYDGGRAGTMVVNTFATGDLFRKGTRQIVALAMDEQGWYQSRLCIFDSDGRLLSGFWHPGHMHQVVIAAMTARHVPRIIISGVNNDLRRVLNVSGYTPTVFMLDPKNVRGEAPPYFGKLGSGSHVWYGVVLPPNQQIERLDILDRNNDGHRDISIWTSTGHVFYLDFEGKIIARGMSDGAKGDAQFGLIATK